MWMRDPALMVRVSVVGWDSVAMARDKLRCSSLKTAPSVEEYGVNGWEGRGLGGGTVICEPETKVWAQKQILTCHLQLRDRASNPLT